MPKIYVANRGGHDYTAAERFGSLVYISDGVLKKDALSQMYRLCQQAMGDSRENDYILITSLASLCSVASSYFATKHQRLNLLVWHEGKYTERHLIFNHSKDQLNDNARGAIETP